MSHLFLKEIKKIFEPRTLESFTSCNQRSFCTTNIYKTHVFRLLKFWKYAPEEKVLLEGHQLQFNPRCYWPGYTSHDSDEITYVYWLEEYQLQFNSCHRRLAYKNSRLQINVPTLTTRNMPFELDCNYHPCIFYEKNIDPRSRSNIANLFSSDHRGYVHRFGYEWIWYRHELAMYGKSLFATLLGLCAWIWPSVKGFDSTTCTL